MQTNAEGTELDCAALPPIEQSLGAHSAPLGMSFAELPEPYGTGALVGRPRFVEPDAAACARGGVLRLA